MNKWIDSLTLEGEIVRLELLTLSHKEALLEAASDGKLWDLWYASVPNEQTIEAYINDATNQYEKGLQYPLVVIHKETNKVIGSTGFYNIQQEHRRLEIGFTFYAKSYQRTAVNTECKCLILEYAFEKKNCIAVQLITNWFNLRSRQAIERLGAKLDGVLRNHKLNPDGTPRDTVVYSITDQEWISVKKSLKLQLAGR